jgi:hypothetical protein
MLPLSIHCVLPDNMLKWKHINILSGKTQWIDSGSILSGKTQWNDSGSILTYYLVKHSGMTVEAY